MTRNPLFVLCSGAFLIGLFIVGAFYPPKAFAAEQLNPFVQTEADNQICPLSNSQQERATQRWADLDRMLRSDPPLCINCHGRMNPFVDGTKHPGGQLKFVHDSKGRRDLLATRQTQCLFCHEAPWQAPFGKDLWHFQNTVQLCTHIRKEFDTAEALQHHLQSDPLADLAFEGKRALNDVGQAIYEGEFGRPPVAETPSFTRGDLTLLASLWTDAMGGKFVGGPTCGCQPHHYLLQLSTDVTFTYVRQDFRGEGHGHADLTIPLTFKDDGSFSGQATTKRPYEGTTIAAAGTCKVTYDDFKETWKVEGAVDKTSMQVKVKLARAESVGTSVCSFVSQAVTAKIDGTQGTHELELDAIVGQSQTLEFKGFLDLAEGGDAWIIKATIVDEDK